MSKLQSLVVSSLASGFGLFSIVLATFMLFTGLSFWSFLRFFLALAFFAINFIFLAYYYRSVSKALESRKHPPRPHDSGWEHDEY